MATIQEARAAEAEVIATLREIRRVIGDANQRIVSLIGRGNITPEEAKEVNDRAAQINATLVPTLEPVLQRLVTIIGEGVGFLNRPELLEIKQRYEQELTSYGQFVDQARANRERLNQLASENQAATAQETANKAAADQGSGAQSAGAETSEAQRAGAEAASTQNPQPGSEQQSATGAISASPPTAVPTNAESSQPAAVPEVAAGPPAAVTATPTAQDQLPGTPAQGQGVLQPPSPSGAQQFYIYKAIMVASNFSGGKFTQDLEGVLLQIPVASAQRQDGVLVPQAPALSDVVDTTPVEARTNSTVVSNEIPGDQAQAQAPPGDATVYGPAETAPPDSGGEPVATAQPSGATGEGSATTTVGGFTIKAVVGPDTGGAAFTVSRGGSTEFAFGVADIYNAAVKLVLAGKGGNDQEVITWVNARGPQALESQALAKAGSNTATPNTSINLARET